MTSPGDRAPAATVAGAGLLVYGANGYTGGLIARAAAARSPA